MKKILTLLIYLMPLVAVSQNSICFKRFERTSGLIVLYTQYTTSTNAQLSFTVGYRTTDNATHVIFVTETFNGSGTKITGLIEQSDPNFALVDFTKDIIIDYIDPIRNVQLRRIFQKNNSVICPNCSYCASTEGCCVELPTVCNFQVSTTSSPTTCYGPGFAAISPIGGTRPYSYTWSDGSIGTGYIYPPSPGTYKVTVSDATNCKSITTFAITECQDCGTVATAQNATCASNGSIDLKLSITMWYFPVTLTWSDGVTNVIQSFTDLSNSAQVGTNGTGTFTRTNVLQGTYTVEITHRGPNKCKRTVTVAKDCDCKEVVNQCKTEWEQEFWRRYGGSACKNWETDCNTTADIRRNGKVAIGPSIKTVPEGFNLAVEGGVIANEVKVQTCRTAPNGAWCDYVFDEKYKLKPLLEVSSYLKANKRLHNMPSTTDIDKAGGYDLGKIALSISVVEGIL